ncbi:MAG: dihydroorotate dehydrogenase (quinone) [Chloroflexi bacterium]|nr:dihydroorotate dehydrogenase (quinone) [Chloroflexota bacterium]
MNSLYKGLLRPLLFALPPEGAQELVKLSLRWHILWQALGRRWEVGDPRLQLSAGGLSFSNPVGVAAGLDKDCEFLPTLMALGFGYVVGGTVVHKARPGNPGPRLLRYVRQQSLVNAMGFPSKGLEAASRRLERFQARPKPLVVSVAGLSIDEFLLCHRSAEPLADAVELNISSPNAAGLLVFLQAETFADLLGRINEGRRKPLFVKIPPYLDAEAQERILGLVRIARREGVEGITAANARRIAEPRLKVGAGGVSGKALFQDMLRIVGDVRREAGDSLMVNACGGIFTASDALQAFQAGATTVQLYTGLVYEGPSVALRINQGLVQYLEKQRLPNVAALTRLAGR